VSSETGFHLFAGVQKTPTPSQFQSLHAPPSPHLFRPPSAVSQHHLDHHTPTHHHPLQPRVPMTQPAHPQLLVELLVRPHSAAPLRSALLDRTPGSHPRYASAVWVVFCLGRKTQTLVFGFQPRRWRLAERRHPTGRERMGSPTLKTLQEPILLLPRLCFFQRLPNPKTHFGFHATTRRVVE
jgi:hypothetical protein